MRYDDRLIDGSDPLYAPGNDRGLYWKAPAKYVRAGYAVKRIRLEGSDLDKAARCRELTREMLAWYDGEAHVEAGTWRWLLGRYKGDEYSPYQEVKANTRATYAREIAKLEEAIGAESLADWNMPRIKRWHQGMGAEGKSVDYTARQVTQIRMVVNYGVQIENAECNRLSLVLSKMKFPKPPPRQKAMTRDQAEAIAAAADEAGHVVFATALLLKFQTALRAVDVVGQWLDEKNGTRWADGLTWDMLDPEVTTLRKVTSKTGAEVEFDMRMLPVVRNRLRAMPRSVGPVFTMKNGKPYQRRYLLALFARFRAKAGVPKDVWFMDTRAGAITEAKEAGASPMDIRDMAGHSNLATTDRYMRGRADGTARVIAMRQEKAG
jgi:integrase